MAWRYINASDVPRLLGKKYRFFWTKDTDISRIIFGKRIKPELQRNIESLPEKVIESIPTVPLDASKKRKCEAAAIYIENNKKEITNKPTHADYTKHETEFVNTLPLTLQSIVQQEFTMERGNVQEAVVLKEFNIPKTNELRYLFFKKNGTGYKIGCRFDGPQIEIKTRKNKFLGVPDYERVQTHLYMAINKDLTWTLKEKFNDQIVDHEIPFDEEFFEEIKTDIHNSWEYFLEKNKN